MLVSSVVHCIAVLVFQLWGVQTLSPSPTCPASCVCEQSSLVNCASLGLSKAPTNIPATATALDLSHNALHTLAPLSSGHVHLRGLRHLWVGNNSLENLSMCSGMQEIVGTRTRRKQRCVSWAPDLQSLSADRNQLKWLPRGLGNIKSLKVLQLSHNRISEVGPADLAGCHHLSELQLQYNLINTIHPEAFKDLQKLKVLDVSYNLLTTIPVPAFLSLRNLNALVDISGNRWRCDCKLKTVRKWLGFDNELGNPTWKVVCSSPSYHAGKDLLDLKEPDLACPQPVYNTPGVKKEVTVDEGMELILSCSTAKQDFMHTRWWTPRGPISDSQQFIHISNTTEHDAGLYICISGYQEEHVSVFNVRIRRRAHDRRLRREALIGSAELNEGDNDNMQRNVQAVRAVQQSQFVLAVCLSVFITFIVAFILGVILRPFLDKWYKQIRNKRNSKRKSASNSQTSSTEQRPYVNEGYSDTDDQELEGHKGPRVTFGGVTEIHEQGNVPYYVTVEGSPSGNNADVVELYAEEKESMTKNIEVHKEEPLREENKESTSSSSIKNQNAEGSKTIQYEYIPDPEDTTELEDRSISPASSLSGERQEPQMSYETKESTEQSVDSPTVSVYEEEDEQACTDRQTTIPGFITDPFPLKLSESKEESVNELDPDLWNDSGESFSFTEGSPRSSSRISNVADLGYPLIQKEMSVDESSDSPSSSESEEREEGPTEYTVNPDDDEDSETQIYDSENDINYGENRLSGFEEKIITDDQKTGTGAQFRQDTITLDPTDIHMTYTRGDSFDDEQFTEYKECFDSSNVSSEDEDEPTQYNVHPVYRTSGRTISLMGEDRSRTSSYSETDQDKQEDDPKRLEIRLENKVPNTDATPVISPDRLFDIGYDNTQSSTDIEDKRSEGKEKGIRKSLSGISALLFNRSGSETSKAVQPEPNSPTTNSKSTGGFLGLSFKKQPSESGNPTTNDSNFFATIGQAFDRLPKLKNSLMFSISAPKPPHQQSTSVKDRISESQRPHVSSSFEESIFGKIDRTLYPIPQVKRYLHFSRRKSYPPIHALPHCGEEEIIPNESKKCTSTSEDDARATTKGDNFFSQIDASFDDLPKVKRYVKFSPSESQVSNHSAPSTPINQMARPEALPKTESPPDTFNICFEGQSISLHSMPKVQRYVQFTHSEPQSVYELTPAIEGDNFFSQIEASIDDLPKVKQYVQFSPSESKPSNHSAPSASVNQEVRSELVSKTEFPPDTFSICFEGQSVPLYAMPKVQRYVQFTQSEPQPRHEHTPTFKEDSFIGQMQISCDDLPKVKHYVQFSPSESKPSNHLTPLASINQVARSEAVSKTESPPDTFSICFEGQSISLRSMPKVQRYVQFTQSEPQPRHELAPTFKEDSFLGQMQISCDVLPKVKRYVQFSPSESKPLNHLTPSASINKEVRSQLVSKKESPPDTISICFEGQSISLHAMPKVQKYIQFTQSEPQPRHELTPTIIGDSFIGQIPVSFDEVPKVKRYILFSQVEPHYQTIPPIRPTKKSIQTHAQLTQSKPQTVHGFTPAVKEDSFFSQIGASIDDLPKVKRYVQFSPSELKLSNHSTSSASVNQVVRSEAVSKTESPPDTFSICFKGQSVPLYAMPKVQRYIQFTQSEPQPRHEHTPTFKEDSFIGHMQISCDDLPKVKHYVQFSPSESKPSNHSASSASINQVARSEAVSKTESPPDTISICFEGQSISLRSMPKVQRYVQFTQSEPQPRHELTSTIKGDSFIGQIPVTFDEVPKVKRYVQFSPSESKPLNHSAPSASINQEARSEAVSKTESPPDTFSICFKGQSTSLRAMPKVQRYIQFTQSEPQPRHELTPTIKGDSFIGQIPVSFDKVPKVKGYVQFSPSESKPLNHLTPSASINKEVRSQLVSKTESPPDTISICFEGQSISLHAMPKVQKYIQFTQSEPQPRHELTPTIIGDSFIGQIPVSFDEVPKVKRHILFSQVEPHYQTIPPIRPTKKSIQTHAQLTQSKPQTVHGFTPAVKEDSFFSQIGASIDDLPKVKCYVQFSPSELKLSNHSTSSASVNQVVRSEAVSKTESPPDTFSICFEGQSISLRSMPKVQRYIRFTQSEPQPRHEHIPTFKEDSFIGQMQISCDDLPKVKHYVQFSPSESKPSNHSASSASINQVARSEAVSKTESPPDAFSICFEGQSISLRAMPKVQRYVQFTQSEPQSVHEVTSAFKKNSFFGQIDASFDDLPKVKRYVQFSPSESQPSNHSTSSGSIKQVARPTPASSELKMKDVSGDYIQPTAGEHNMFGPIGASSGIPKVRRYIQFSQRSTQPSSLPSHRQTATPVLTKGQSSSLPVHSKLDNEDTFFKKMDSSVSELPKVKRYIQFTHHPAPLKSSNTNGVTDDIAKKKELWASDLSMGNIKPPVTDDNFFGQVGANLTSLPRVNRYIQFTQSEPHPSSQLQPQTEKMTKKELKTVSSSMDTDTNLSTKDTFLDGIVASLDNIPKVKKALLFTQSEHQNFNQIEVPQKVTAQSVAKSQSGGSSSLSNEDVFPKRQDKFFGQLGVSLDEVPRVKKYIQFSQSEAYTPTRSSVNIKGDQSPLPFFKTEIVTPELITKTEPSIADSPSERKHRTDIKDDIFLGQTDTSFNEVPKVKRYLQFTKSDREPAAPSSSTSVITEHVTPEYLTKIQSTRSEDKLSPTSKGDDFFGQTGTSFDGMPKVKRYIQFTQAEPHLQPSKRTEKTIPASSELKTKHNAGDYIQSAAGEHSVFEPIGASSEIPKVRRYIQFSQRSTQPSSQTATPVLTKPDVRQSSSLPVHSKSDNEDTFFKTLDSSASELPKVKRYIQFTQHYSSLPKSSNTHGDTYDVAKKRELWGSDLSMVDVKTPLRENRFRGQLETKLNSLPRVDRYIQFTQPEPYPSSQSQPHHNRTATDDKSSQPADNLSGSLDVSYNQVPTLKRYVQIEQSEPYRSSMVPSKFLSLESEHRFPFEKGFKLTTKKNDSFGQTDGVPRLIRYTQVQSEPHTLTQNQEQSLQDAPSALKVTTETSRLNQLPQPKRSFLSNPDAYRLQDQVEEVFRQTSSVSSSGNTQGSTTASESKLSGLGASSNESVVFQTRKHLDMEPALHDISQSASDPPEASSEIDNARMYLRDSSLARQRQERRRVLFQQKKRAMDGFSLTSDSFTSQESDQ